MPKVRAFAALTQAAPLEPFEYDLGELGPDQLDIKIEYCGICHSDLAMLHNDWGMTQYPLVPGHEVVGTVERKGEHVRGLSFGQRVGLGWYSGSCYALPRVPLGRSKSLSHGGADHRWPARRVRRPGARKLGVGDSAAPNARSG